MSLPEDCAANVNIMDGGLRRGFWRRLEAALERSGRKFRINRLEPDMQAIGNLKRDADARVMAYARLLIPDALEAERVVYIDSDFVINRNLAATAQMPLDGSIVLACQDAATQTFAGEMAHDPELLRSSTQFNPHLGDFQTSAPYFNSGFMVIDIPAWRACRIGERTREYILKHPERCPYWDQSGLNVTLYKRWSALPQECNVFAKTVNYGKLDARAAGLNVHFTGREKPWLRAGSNTLAARCFYHQLDACEPGGWRPGRISEWAALLGCRAARLRRRWHGGPPEASS